MKKTFIIFLIVLLITIFSTAQEYFIFIDQDSIHYDGTIKIEENKCFLSDEAIRLLNLKKVKDNKYNYKQTEYYFLIGSIKYNLISFKGVYLFNKGINVFNKYESFKQITVGARDSDIKEMIVLENENIKFCLIDIKYIDLMKENEKKYKEFLTEIEIKQKKIQEVTEKDKYEGLTSNEISLGEMLIQNIKVQIKCQVLPFSFIKLNPYLEREKIILYFSDEMKTIITINENKLFIEYISKFVDWYNKAKENKTTLNKEIGNVASYIDWIYSGKKHTSAATYFNGGLRLSFITKDNDYFLSFIIEESFSFENKYIIYPEKNLMINYKNMKLLNDILNQENLDNLIKKQIEIDKTNNNLFK